MKKNPLVFQQHVNIAIELWAMRDRLNALEVELWNRYGITKSPGKKANRARRAIDSLRSTLDDQLSYDHPREYRSSIYYRSEGTP